MQAKKIIDKNRFVKGLYKESNENGKILRLKRIYNSVDTCNEILRDVRANPNVIYFFDNNQYNKMIVDLYDYSGECEYLVLWQNNSKWGKYDYDSNKFFIQTITQDKILECCVCYENTENCKNVFNCHGCYSPMCGNCINSMVKKICPICRKSFLSQYKIM